MTKAVTLLSGEGTLPPAPGADVYPSLDFANSAVTLPNGRFLDLLHTPSSATAWLATRDLAPTSAELQELCANRLRTLREQVRALLAAAIQGLPPPGEALSAVNDALLSVPASSLLRWDEIRGLHRTPSHPIDQVVDHALALLAASTADLLVSRDAARLNVCRSAPCNRFLLRTHGRRYWCCTRCGDRARGARAYARSRGLEAASA